MTRTRIRAWMHVHPWTCRLAAIAAITAAVVAGDIVTGYAHHAATAGWFVFWGAMLGMKLREWQP